MVAASSEAGQVTMEKLKRTEKEQQIGRQEQLKASEQSDLELTRIRSQR